MHEIKDFLENITLILFVSAITSYLFYKLRQPLVLGYILAGMIIGPYLPIPLVADSAIVHTLSEIGVILLMFSLGLEFSIRKFFKVLPVAGLIAIIQSALMIWLGYVAGRAFGWNPVQSFYAGAIITISSTIIIAKTFSEMRLKGPVTDIVFGVLIVEDLIAILLLAGLPLLTQTTAASGWELAKTTGTLFMFLLTLLVGGMLIIPRITRSVVRAKRPEMSLVVSIGLCFAISVLAKKMGYSVALGAFMAGSLMAEAGEEGHLEHLVRPVRDMFVSVFFVSVGMLIDPFVIAKNWLMVLVFALIVIFGKIIGVVIGALLTGYNTRLSIRSGISMAQIGEFSFIIAGVGVATGVAHEATYPLAVAVSAITTLTTPWLIKCSDPIANWVDRRMPHRLQLFTTLYGSWIQRLRQSTPLSETSRLKRLLFLLSVDVLCLTSITMGAILSMDTLVMRTTTWIDMPEAVIRIGGIAIAIALATPFFIGIVNCIRSLGQELSSRILPERVDGKLDLAATPRRMLMLSLQFAIVILFGMPLVTITQPFVPDYLGAGLLILALMLLGVFFWRGTTQLQGHVHAGAQLVLEMLNRSSPQVQPPEIPLEQVLPGLGKVVSVSLQSGNAAIGLSLSKVNLRSLTGASVIAITRGEKGVLVPTGNETLLEGDLLAITGTDEAVMAAKEILQAVREQPYPAHPGMVD